jgi:hypothetical protein
VIWFFHKGGDELRLETHFDRDSGEYVAQVHNADCTTQSDRFHNADVFGAYLRDLEGRLVREHWRRARAPILIPGRWPKKAIV